MNPAVLRVFGGIKITNGGRVKYTGLAKNSGEYTTKNGKTYTYTTVEVCNEDTDFKIREIQVPIQVTPKSFFFELNNKIWDFISQEDFEIVVKQMKDLHCGI